MYIMSCLLCDRASELKFIFMVYKENKYWECIFGGQRITPIAKPDHL